MIVNWCLLAMFCGSSPALNPPAQPSLENPAFVKGDEGSTLHLICESESAQYHQWFQGYVIGKLLKEITFIPLQTTVKKTRYVITLEKFDDNTAIYCKRKKYYEDKYSSSLELKLKYFTGIMVSSETQKPIEKPSAILTYSETKNALFSCENYANIVQDNVHVGVIDMIFNTIIAYNRKSIETHVNFNITHSRTTVLCCIYYEVIDIDKETRIIRHVANKTLLIYDDDMSNTSLDNATTGYTSYNNSLEATQNITCIHRYLNVTGNQQKEIANYTLPIQNKIDKSFFIKVEQFDNNTEIYCVKDKNESIMTNALMSADIGSEITVLKLSGNSSITKTTIKVTKVTLTKNEEYISLKYNETKNVSFSCQEYTAKTNDVQLGIINKTSNIIKTILETKINQTFSIINNGTILCCIYYVSNEYNTTRFVTNKTLLVYDDGNKIGQEDIPKGTANITNDANTDPDDEQALTTASSNQPKIYKIVTAVALTVFILLIVIVIWKRRCRKKTKSNHKVLYAELDHIRQTEPGTSARPDIRSRPNPEEESPYAEIIGEMRPNLDEESPYAQIIGEMGANVEEESPYAQVTGEMRPNPEESPYAQVTGEMRPNPEESPYAQIIRKTRPR